MKVLFTSGKTTFNVKGVYCAFNESTLTTMKSNKFSMVERGFGLGRNNSLYLENLRTEQKRFQNLKAPPRYSTPNHLQPRNRSTIRAQIGEELLESAPRLVDIYQFDTGLENEYDNTVFPYTPEFITSNKQREFENDKSVFFPEHALRRSVSRPVPSKWRRQCAWNCASPRRNDPHRR